MPIFTIGHSTRPFETFLHMLKDAGVNYLADVRRFPHSRRQPQFNIETMPEKLKESGIEYVHMPALGGRRPARKDGVPSPHTLWREESFRNYADHAETPEFRNAFTELLESAQTKRVAIMCAEALWWQCHRRIIADYLLANGIEVEHILEGKTEPAHLTPGAIVRPDRSVLYSDTPLLDNI
jgi:uncharacterized protein (DUF488 family)